MMVNLILVACYPGAYHIKSIIELTDPSNRSRPVDSRTAALSNPGVNVKCHWHVLTGEELIL
jgi:hypothetical protein